MVDTPSKISSVQLDVGLSGTEDVRRRPDDPNGVNAIGVKCGKGETIISIGRLVRKKTPENNGIRTFSKTDSKYTWMIFDKNSIKNFKITNLGNHELQVN